MTLLRFQLVSLAALVLAAPALAQITQGQIGNVRDIEVSRAGDKVSILIQLSQQPSSAEASSTDKGLSVQIEGVDLLNLQLDPPAGSLVTRVEAAGKQITLTGAGFGEASTVIYRNAVLIETRLAEPPIRGASIMAVKADAPATIVAPAPKTPEAKPPAPQANASQAQPSPAPAAASLKPVDAASTKPLDLKPAAAKPSPAKAPPAPAAPAANDHLETKPPPPAKAPAAPKAQAVPVSNPAVTAGTAALAGLNAQRCAIAVGDLETDPWSMEALGNHALCLIDQGKSKEAANRLDQLAAFAPEDWRVSLGRAILAAEKGDASNAEVGYRTAAQLAPDEIIRAAILDRVPKPAAH
jgi:hypothetical protein